MAHRGKKFVPFSEAPLPGDDGLSPAALEHLGLELRDYYKRLLAEHIPEHLLAIVMPELERLYEPPNADTKH